MNIQQGNYLEGRTVDQLQAGMTRSQVRYLLGTPMVPDAFDKERWDYLYYFKKGRLRKPEERHLIVYFKEDKVDKFERNNVLDKAPQGPEEGPSVSKFRVLRAGGVTRRCDRDAGPVDLSAARSLAAAFAFALDARAASVTRVAGQRS